VVLESGQRGRAKRVAPPEVSFSRKKQSIRLGKREPDRASMRAKRTLTFRVYLTREKKKGYEGSKKKDAREPEAASNTKKRTPKKKKL